MGIEESWNSALKNTEIIRSRVQALMTVSDTKVPYILLSESSINSGDTVVRRGEILVEKPSLFVPPNNPFFKGFEFEENDGFDQNSFINFLLVRGISIPSLMYDNKTYSLDIFEGKISKAVKHYQSMLQEKEDVVSGLILGPEEFWQFSLLIFICGQIAKNAGTDIKKLLGEYKKKSGSD